MQKKTVFLLGVALFGAGMGFSAFVGRDKAERPASSYELAEVCAISKGKLVSSGLSEAFSKRQISLGKDEWDRIAIGYAKAEAFAWGEIERDFWARMASKHYLNVRDYEWGVNVDTGKFVRIERTPTVVVAASQSGAPSIPTATASPTKTHK